MFRLPAWRPIVSTERRQVVIEFDVALFQAMLAQGWKGNGVECIQGLPPTAKFIGTIPSEYRPNIICLVFEDESFAPIPADCWAIPHFVALYEKHEPTESQETP